MTCGTPVIASDLPGVRVPVQSTGMGMVVPAANPVILAQAIIHVLENPQAYRGHPEAFIQASTPAEVAKAYERVFILASETMLARKNART